MPKLSDIAAKHPERNIQFTRKGVTGVWHHCPKCGLKFRNHTGEFYYRKNLRDYGKGVAVGFVSLMAICILAFVIMIGAEVLGGGRFVLAGTQGALSVIAIFFFVALYSAIRLKKVVHDGDLDACPRCLNEDILPGRGDADERA